MLCGDIFTIRMDNWFLKESGGYNWFRGCPNKVIKNIHTTVLWQYTSYLHIQVLQK